VAYIYENGPCDKDWVKVKVGDYLIAIDGTPVLSDTNYWKTTEQRAPESESRRDVQLQTE